jgi:hypothetical protein
VFEEGDVKVYRVGDPLPRAWVVHNLIEAGREETLAIVNREGFDPRTEAVAAPDSRIIVDVATPGEADAVRVVEHVQGRVLLEVTAGSDGLLVVSQPEYAGWQAQVDGRAVRIHEVNGLLQGIPVPAGSHQVEISYRLSLAPAIISLIVLLGSLTVALWSHR